MSKKLHLMFDEHLSNIASTVVKNAKNRVAEMGFWPGGRPPTGYALTDTKDANGTLRKKLIVDEGQRSTIERIYRLYLLGDRQSAPLGIRSIYTLLNKEGSSLTRDGSRWSGARIHSILKNPVYHGKYVYNARAKPDEFGDRDAPIIIACPSIIEKGLFEQVQLRLQVKDPKSERPYFREIA